MNRKNRLGGNSGPPSHSDRNLQKHIESLAASQNNQMVDMHRQATSGKEIRHCPACGSVMFLFNMAAPIWASMIVTDKQVEVYPPVNPDLSVAICGNPECQKEWNIGEMVRMEESRERHWTEREHAGPPFYVAEGRHMKVKRELTERIDELVARIKKLEENA